jgi:hypothetical protein
MQLKHGNIALGNVDNEDGIIVLVAKELKQSFSRCKEVNNKDGFI